MKRYTLLLYLSLILISIAGIVFVRINRYVDTSKVIENLKNKTIIVYSSNFKRMYLNSKPEKAGDMDLLCIEGASKLNTVGMNSVNIRISDGTMDAFSLSESYLKRYLKKDEKYILMDFSRGQTRHGGKYEAGGKICCPITIKVSKKSQCYDTSLLFAGRVKSAIDEKFRSLPVHIVTVDDRDYNQSMGYIAMLVEFGDAASTYDEARESLSIFCQAVAQVINMNN